MNEPTLDGDAVEIRRGDCATRESCARCGVIFTPDVGPWPFVNGWWERPLCPGCMERISPAVRDWWERQRDVFLLCMKRERGTLTDTLTLPSNGTE
jgi:hypothetical protein